MLQHVALWGRALGVACHERSDGCEAKRLRSYPSVLHRGGEWWLDEVGSGGSATKLLRKTVLALQRIHGFYAHPPPPLVLASAHKIRIRCSRRSRRQSRQLRVTSFPLLARRPQMTRYRTHMQSSCRRYAHTDSADLRIVAFRSAAPGLPRRPPARLGTRSAAVLVAT